MSDKAADAKSYAKDKKEEAKAKTGALFDTDYMKLDLHVPGRNEHTRVVESFRLDDSILGLYRPLKPPKDVIAH